MEDSNLVEKISDLAKGSQETPLSNIGTDSPKTPVSSIATGRRKAAVAQVKIIDGSGEITINGKKGVIYLQENAYYIGCVKAPLILLNVENLYDFKINVKGGGFLGQAKAIQLGISRALCDAKQSYRHELKQNGFLRRDSRVKERKKYGLKKARKAPQYSKR